MLLLYPLIKRLCDAVVSSFALMLLSPLLVTIAVLIRLDSNGPVLYRGIRAGKGGRPFRMLKFRTMVVHADQIGGPSTSADDPRITKIGKRLRLWKLDELPQLINVLKGDMSFVGPRPEVPSEVARYTPEERAILSAPPGITDWASVRFRNEGEILKGCTDPHEGYLEKIRPEKMRLALEYVRRRGLLIDLQIVIRTAVTLFESGTSKG